MEETSNGSRAILLGYFNDPGQRLIEVVAVEVERGGQSGAI